MTRFRVMAWSVTTADLFCSVMLQSIELSCSLLLLIALLLVKSSWAVFCRPTFFNYFFLFKQTYHAIHLPVTVISQCKLVSGWTLRKRISVPLYGSEKFFVFTISLPRHGKWKIRQRWADLSASVRPGGLDWLRQRCSMLCHAVARWCRYAVVYTRLRSRVWLWAVVGAGLRSCLWGGALWCRASSRVRCSPLLLLLLLMLSLSVCSTSSDLRAVFCQLPPPSSSFSVVTLFHQHQSSSSFLLCNEIL